MYPTSRVRRLNGNRLPDPELRIEVAASLVVQPHLHRRTLDPLPGERLTSTRDHIEQGRLPGAVGADDAEALTAAEQIEPRDQRRLVVVADRHAVEFHDLAHRPRCALVHRVEIEITIASGGLGSLIRAVARSIRACFRVGLRPGAEPGKFRRARFWRVPSAAAARSSRAARPSRYPS